MKGFFSPERCKFQPWASPKRPSVTRQLSNSTTSRVTKPSESARLEVALLLHARER